MESWHLLAIVVGIFVLVLIILPFCCHNDKNDDDFAKRALNLKTFSAYDSKIESLLSNAPTDEFRISTVETPRIRQERSSSRKRSRNHPYVREKMYETPRNTSEKRSYV